MAFCLLCYLGFEALFLNIHFVCLLKGVPESEKKTKQTFQPGINTHRSHKGKSEIICILTLLDTKAQSEIKWVLQHSLSIKQELIFFYICWRSSWTYKIFYFSFYTNLHSGSSPGKGKCISILLSTLINLKTYLERWNVMETMSSPVDRIQLRKQSAIHFLHPWVSNSKLGIYHYFFWAVNGPVKNMWWILIC